MKALLLKASILLLAAGGAVATETATATETAPIMAITPNPDGEKVPVKPEAAESALKNIFGAYAEGLLKPQNHGKRDPKEVVPPNQIDAEHISQFIEVIAEHSLLTAFNSKITEAPSAKKRGVEEEKKDNDKREFNAAKASAAEQEVKSFLSAYAGGRFHVVNREAEAEAPSRRDLTEAGTDAGDEILKKEEGSDGNGDGEIELRSPDHFVM
ncbi:hypothetical protein F5Y16DRAFT_404251 [Xylariaceae sp. FL0255]|nr:hypothetical protein F5Y16DRAFT_404251 [Xylariaceae sp. FL0255]